MFFLSFFVVGKIENIFTESFPIFVGLILFVFLNNNIFDKLIPDKLIIIKVKREDDGLVY